MIRDEGERKRQAIEAAGEWVKSHNACIVNGAPNKLAHDVGSATVFASASGRVALLTANHNLQEVLDGGKTPMRVGAFALDALIVDALAEWEPCPGGHDVALAWVTDDAARQLAANACPAECIAVGTDRRLDRGEWGILSGFPAKLVFHNWPSPKVLEQLFNSIFYITECTGRSRDGKLSFEWTTGLAAAATERFLFLDLPEVPDFRTPEPFGISGGSAWRLRDLSDSELWAAEKRLRLVGVPCSWNSVDKQYAEPVERWGDWLLERLAS